MFFGYALLDFDGYICKSYYAAIARDKNASFEDMDEILESLTKAAIDKTEKYFHACKRCVKVVSGHTFKKDIYPSYKRQRTRDERLGEYREHVISSDSSIIRIAQLEADDVCISIDRYLNSTSDEPRSIIFSDDKDLRKYCMGYYCKINLTEEVQYPNEYSTAPYIQMLTGDKEDNVKGIPLVGDKKAIKYLEETDYNLESVIIRYIDAKLDIDECLKNILLVTPILIDDPEYISALLAGAIDPREDKVLLANITQCLSRLSEAVKEYYDKYD